MKYRWKDSCSNEKHHPDSDLQSRTTTHKIPGQWVASIIRVMHNGVTRNFPEFHPRSSLETHESLSSHDSPI